VAATENSECIICRKERAAYKCEGCSQNFGNRHLLEHHQELGKQLDEIFFNKNLIEEIINLEKQFLIK
jgi:hypothetical protein